MGRATMEPGAGEIRILFAIVTRTVDFAFPWTQHEDMSQSKRGSRFRDVAPQTELLASDDKVSATQRTRRSRALNWLLFRMLSEDREGHDAFVVEHGLLVDEQDRNDALRVAIQADRDWVARWVLAEQDGVMVCRSLLLEPRSAQTPAGGITTNLLRELSPLSVATNSAPSTGAAASVIESWDADRRRAYGPSVEAPRAPRGRPPVDDAELAAVALAYLAEVGRGPGVTRRVATQLAMVEDTVRDRIRMARARDFLTPTKRGRRGGSAGPALRPFQENES